MRFLIYLLTAAALIFAGTRADLEAEISGLTGKAKIEKTLDLAEFIYDEDGETALRYINEAVQYATEKDEPVILMKARHTLGNIHFGNSEYRNAGEEYKNSLILSEKVNKPDYIYKNCKQLGAVFYYLSDFKTSIIFYYKALELSENLEDGSKKADILNALGSVHDEIRDFDKALDFFEKAGKIFTELEDDLGLAKVYNNTAVTYNNRNDYDRALESFEKALVVYKDHGKDHNQAIIMNNMASIHISKRNIDKALDYLRISEKIFREKNDNFGVALSEHNYGKAYFHKGDYTRAERYLKSSNEKADRMGVKFLLRDNYHTLATTDSARSRFKSAYENHLKYFQIDKEILEQEKQREIFDVTAKYELAQKEKQTFSLIRDNEIKRLQLDKQRQINNFFIILFVLLIGISYLAYRSYTLKAKNEELLKDYSEEIENFNNKLLEEIEKTKKELQESNEKLVETEKEAARMDKLASLGIMIAGITHEIKNPTQVIKLSMDSVRLALNDMAVFIYAMIKLCRSGKGSSSEIKKIIEEHKVKKMFTDIKNLVISNQKSVDLIDKIVSSTLKIGKFDLESSDHSINEIIGDVLVIIRNSIKYTADIELELRDDIPLLKCNYQEIAQILINLLTNARDAIEAKENSEGDGRIKISSGKENGNVYFEVYDNGTGMTAEQKEKMFEPFYSTKTDGKGNGLGLYILRGITDSYKAGIKIESNPGEGTCFRIIFPVKNVNNGEEENAERD